jgi:BirA family biotin operon repressor/biotin-[acetyl-CoA-carboxylase] ligase
MPIYDISQEAIEMATSRWGKPVQFFETCDSSNNRAVEWARQGAVHGSLVVTDHQTHGRGRGNRDWFSLPSMGSLLFSVIIRPKIPTGELGLVSLGAGVAASLSLAERKLAARLKWPNDIVTRGRKLGGILCESEIAAGKVSFVVVGIGINMRITRDQFPRELQATATSCVMETGRNYDRADVLAGILTHLEPILKDLDAGRTHNILNSYAKLCETIGKTVSTKIHGAKVVGRAINLDDFGGLVLDTGDVIPVGDVDHLE